MTTWRLFRVIPSYPPPSELFDTDSESYPAQSSQIRGFQAPAPRRSGGMRAYKTPSGGLAGVSGF
jgi:hypothetical protein